MLIGVRHWDTNMRQQFQAKYGKNAQKKGWWRKLIRFCQGRPQTPKMHGLKGQGFIDQFSRWYDREEAMLLARANKQIIVPDHQMLSLIDLHSEDLW